MSFVHLHVHSQYSLLEATPTIETLVAKAKAHQMSACALTDYGNMFGAIEFYFAAKDAGLQALIGMDAYVSPQGRTHKSGDKKEPLFPRLVLLAKNSEGYGELCRLSTAGYMEGFYYKPRVDLELLSRYSENLIALSGGLRGWVAQTYIQQGPDQARELILQLKKIYKERFFLQLVRLRAEPWEDAYLQFLLET